MKIATFNINGVVRRLDNLRAWLDIAQPDVVCLQELKATDKPFPRSAIEAAGYGAVWRGEPAWKGVTILARGSEAVLTRDTLPGNSTNGLTRMPPSSSATGLPVVLAGDYNVVPEPRDIYATTSYDDNALVQPASRAAFAKLLDQGWISPKPLAARRRAAPRPFSAQPQTRAAARRCRRRHGGKGRRKRQRPRADLGPV